MKISELIFDIECRVQSADSGLLWYNFLSPRKLTALSNTTAQYNSIDLIPSEVVWVSDTDITRKETSLSFLFIELVSTKKSEVTK